MITELLEALYAEYETLLSLMERVKSYALPEATTLGFALEECLRAYRQLRAGEIDVPTALRLYQVASNAEVDCQSALTYAELKASGFTVLWKADAQEVTP